VPRRLRLETLHGWRRARDGRRREHGQAIALALRFALLEEKAPTTKPLHHPVPRTLQHRRHVPRRQLPNGTDVELVALVSIGAVEKHRVHVGSASDRKTCADALRDTRRGKPRPPLRSVLVEVHHLVRGLKATTSCNPEYARRERTALRAPSPSPSREGGIVRAFAAPPSADPLLLFLGTHL
jgi:hypothetical protein